MLELRSFLIVLLASAALGYLTVLAGMYLFQRRLLYHPDRTPPASPSSLGLEGVSDIWLTAEDGVRLNAWYAQPKEGRAVVLYLHGNAGNLDRLADRFRMYLDMGFGLLALDWRGYGKSEGAPTEEGLYADGRAALAFLKDQGIDAKRIVLHGESLGSGVATKLAVTAPVAALILEAPYLSVAEAAQFHYPYLPARWLVRDRFDNLSRIKDIQAPLLILYGNQDGTVPVAHGHALLAAAGPKAEGRFFAKAGHMDVFDHGALETVQTFLHKGLLTP